ncbi:hypothetical protein BH09PSE6_BH09PSE6_24370 [soil metagenome]
MSVVGCGSPLPLDVKPVDEVSAHARLLDSALAHGLEAYRRIRDINVSYEGEWRPLIGRIQPELIDPGFRGGSQERLMPARGRVGQRHTGPMGHKQVAWHRESARSELGDVQVWLNDQASRDEAVLQTSALVAEGYCVFLLGPLWLSEQRAAMSMRSNGTERVDGRACDAIDIWFAPGLGRVAADRLTIWIDRNDSLMRRVRFTLEGFRNTQGAVAEVELYDHQRRFGIVWPTRFYERLKHPLPLPVHDWRLTGLDVDRGYDVDAIAGPAFLASAAAPARGW